MTTSKCIRAEAFRDFEEQFRFHADRVQQTWNHATEAFPELHKKPGIVRVNLEILQAQALAAEHRNRSVFSALEEGCHALLGSEFLRRSGVGAPAISAAVELLAASWREERQGVLSQFKKDDVKLAEKEPDTYRQFSLVDQCHVQENTLWFLAGYAEALAVFEGLIPYEKPAARQKKRKDFDKRIRGLQSRIPHILADHQLQLAVPTDVLVALQMLHANERGLKELFDDLARGTLKIDAAMRDSKQPGQLGAMPRDVLSRICYVAFQTFGTPPREAVVQLSTGFEVADRTWTRDQIDQAIDIGIERVKDAHRRQMAIAQQARVVTPRLWAFGQPQPLPRI
jgi:hypothetical protein